MQVVATLYGSTNISERNHVRIKTCYYFRNSEFYKDREHLDGAIVAEVTGEHIEAKLYLNTLSPRFGTFQASAFRGAFDKAVVDPLMEEAAGDALVADCDVDRGRPREILEYLRTKYRTDYLTNMDMAYVSVE